MESINGTDYDCGTCGNSGLLKIEVFSMFSCCSQANGRTKVYTNKSYSVTEAEKQSPIKYSEIWGIC